MHPKKLKTLIILTPGFPANEEDSTCIPPQQLFVKALKEVNPGLNIVVIAFRYPFFSREYQWNGIKVISLGEPTDNRFLRLFSSLRVWRILRKLNKEHQLIGLLSFWLGKCALTGSRFAKRYTLPHYCWILGQDAKKGNKYVNRIRPAGESLIALSDFIVREFNRNYGIKPAHIIPVGIDTASFSALNVERDIDVSGAGSLIPLKQYPVFMEVINELKNVFPDIKAVICGNGPGMKKLSIMNGNMHLKDNILLAGRLAHKEVLATMQRSKVFLHTSAYEGFGAVCLEALHAGAHVVSFVKPMDADIQNWHIAVDKADMVQIVKAILLNPNTVYTSTMSYPIQANAKAAIALFDYSEPAIS
jgi:glycosyltransferase involved in cell wall biosynthesis